MTNLATFLLSPPSSLSLSLSTHTHTHTHKYTYIYIYIYIIYIYISFFIVRLTHVFDLLSLSIFPQVIYLSLTLLLPNVPLHFMTYPAGIYTYVKRVMALTCIHSAIFRDYMCYILLTFWSDLSEVITSFYLRVRTWDINAIHAYFSLYYNYKSAPSCEILLVLLIM